MRRVEIGKPLPPTPALSLGELGEREDSLAGFLSQCASKFYFFGFTRLYQALLGLTGRGSLERGSVERWSSGMESHFDVLDGGRFEFLDCVIVHIA